MSSRICITMCYLLLSTKAAMLSQNQQNLADAIVS